MKVIRTIPVKLSVPDNLTNVLIDTINNYTNAYNYCCQTGFDNNIYNGVRLHHATYSSIRDYLPSQLAISARMCAIQSLKSLKTKQKKSKFKLKCPQSKRMSILLDRNSYTVWFDKHELSLLTCSGRLRLPIKVNKYLQPYLTWKYTSATLKFKKNNKFFLNIVFEKDVEEIPKSGKYIGIDRGIKKLAVTSDNKFFLGGETRRVSQRYQRLRRTLQKKGSRSAKRHLCRVSGKEQRFKADVNHNISKKIIESLNPGDTIVLESLSGIRNKRVNKKQRKNIHSWNYYQLEQFLIYKAQAKSIYIEYVDARYTSQRCSRCGYIDRSNRKSQSDFRCCRCSFKLNADLNAARNIVLKHLEIYKVSDRDEVNHPNVPALRAEEQAQGLVP